EFCQRDCCSDPCYEAVFLDQGWDGLLLFLRYKVGWSETQPNITTKFYVGLRDRCTQPCIL
ncbi:hypothetical protein, partial [Nostoc sp. FACHB-133]|uniref:hypothetical protein n=1 Tax=Nostoc sp. FACHB-133 TaxID=2692835 RepID=UPI001A7EEBD9